MKLYPEIVFAVKRNPETACMVGGVKLFFIAKHYDRKRGSGIIHEKEFRNYFNRYVGLSRATYYRWRKQALDLGLFEEKPGSILLILAWGKAARAVGCDRVEKPVDVSLDKFAGSQDLSEVWAGYIKLKEPKPATDKAPAQKHRPITKEAHRRNTGIPERTQRRYDDKAGIVKHANHALVCSDLKKKPELAITEQSGGYYANNGKHYKRLGNTSKAPKRVKVLPKGRTAKINHTITETLSKKAGSELTERMVKLFYTPKQRQRYDKKSKQIHITKITPEKQIERGLRKMAKVDAQRRPERLFCYERDYQGIGLWTACDVALGVFA